MVAAADTNKWQTPIPKAVQEQVDVGEKMLKDLQAGKLVVHNPDLNQNDTDGEGSTAEAEHEEEPTRDTEDEWEHKYKVLKGKYDNETRELRTANTAKDSKIASLTETITNLNDLLVSRSSDHSSEPERVTAPKASTGRDLVLDKDRYSAYGEEIEQLVEYTNSLKEELDRVKQDTGRITQEKADAEQDRFESALSKLCPKWRAINQDPAFYEGWLGSKYVPSTNEWTVISPAHQKLIDASRARDVQAVAKIFKLYLQMNSGTTEEIEETDQHPLESLVTPDVGTGAGVPGGTKARNVTPEQFAKATQDKIHGRISEEQYNAIARDFQATQQRQSGRKK